MSIQYTAPGFEPTALEHESSFHKPEISPVEMFSALISFQQPMAHFF